MFLGIKEIITDSELKRKFCLKCNVELGVQKISKGKGLQPRCIDPSLSIYICSNELRIKNLVLLIVYIFVLKDQTVHSKGSTRYLY